MRHAPLLGATTCFFQCLPLVGVCQRHAFMPSLPASQLASFVFHFSCLPRPKVGHDRTSTSTFHSLYSHWSDRWKISSHRLITGKSVKLKKIASMLSNSTLLQRIPLHYATYLLRDESRFIMYPRPDGCRSSVQFARSRAH